MTVKPSLDSNAFGESGRLATIIVDMQNDYCHPDGVFAQEVGLTPTTELGDLVAAVNGLVVATRSRGLPVIWIRMEWDSPDEMGLLAKGFLAGGGLRSGTWGAELVEGLDVQSGDRFVSKTRFSAFFDTGLEALLEELEVSGLLFGGVRTDYCVESTVRDAFFRDYPAWVVRECVAGFLDGLHEGSLELMDTMFASVISIDSAVKLLSEASS